MNLGMTCLHECQGVERPPDVHHLRLGHRRDDRPDELAEVRRVEASVTVGIAPSQQLLEGRLWSRRAMHHEVGESHAS